MAHEEREREVSQALCLRVVAERDPGALARVLNCFTSLNAIPRRVVAEFSITGEQHIRVDIAGLTERHLSLIAAKLGQAPMIESAYWHHL